MFNVSKKKKNMFNIVNVTDMKLKINIMRLSAWILNNIKYGNVQIPNRHNLRLIHHFLLLFFFFKQIHSVFEIHDVVLQSQNQIWSLTLKKKKLVLYISNSHNSRY